MTIHITIRLAWHSDGWNGYICRNPKENTYCIGRHSYPGDMISTNRNLVWESREDVAGKPCSILNDIPACAYSINAFGDQQMRAYADPPIWFRDSSKRAYIDIPPSTVCIWNYEGMYGEDVINESTSEQKYDYKARLENAKKYFGELQENYSLLFYYANYSNPFSEDDTPKYVIVGISRLKKVEKIHYYEGASEKNKLKYAGGFVWQMPITSHYPNQGFRIPYEKYLDKPKVLNRILLVPDNPRNFKYATRPISHDDALSIVERLLEIVKVLIEVGDNTQNWEERKNWLLNLISELWKTRGAYPGLPEILNYLDLNEGIEYYRQQTLKENDKNAYEKITDFIISKTKEIKGLTVSQTKIKEFRRDWNLREKEEQKLLIEILPRFDLNKLQIANIINAESRENCISATLSEIIENPYILSEQYIGDDIDDYISFNRIDHGILPSPELGLEKIGSKKSPERFRALCIEVLKREIVHSFVPSSKILYHINNKLSYLPEWKNHEFKKKNFEVDEEFLEKAITIKNYEDEKYLYLNEVHEDERLIQTTIEQLARRPVIKFKVPITEHHFYTLLKDPNSQLYKKAPKEYDEALKGQAKVCQKVFNKTICVISGAAGTGKTTIIKSIIKSIEKAHGEGSNIFLLAPTGKASERIKVKTDRTASTIHSFLAKNGWLNENFTFKRMGGKESTVTTLIIDESSMIDLHLFATLFRAINWNIIQRLILVGDPNQLPPIGRGKVFADIINWLKQNHPDNLGRLDINVRHLENRITNKGNGILDLAEIYIQEKQTAEAFDKTKQETVLRRVQEGGEVDKDLRVIYWKNVDDLELILKFTIIKDLESDTKQKSESDKAYLLWQACCKREDGVFDPTYLQVLSPFRGEFYGTDYLNTVFQKLFNGYQSAKATLDGIALFDKVIQFRNRPKTDQISAYSLKDKKPKYIEVFNGEIGFVKPHPFDKDEWKGRYFRIKRFQVVFDRKENYWVGFGSMLGKDENDKWLDEEKPEENLELGYVISVHKAQGSEFERVYFILPKKSSGLLSMELIYTAITRAQKHLTILAQEDISTFLALSRIEKSNLLRINSSIFEFNPLPEELFRLSSNWYEDQKIISTLSNYFVRSKSEMNIANILQLKGVPFEYEIPLFADDGTMYLPDFTITWQGEKYYWEHIGRLDLPEYKNHWETKKKWYEKYFPDQLIVTYESEMQNKDIENILKDKFYL